MPRLILADEIDDPLFAVSYSCYLSLLATAKGTRRSRCNEIPLMSLVRVKSPSDNFPTVWTTRPSPGCPSDSTILPTEVSTRRRLPLKRCTLCELAYSYHAKCFAKVADSRWEVEIDAVYLDGKKLADSTQQPNGISKPSVSALIDTVSSLLCVVAASANHLSAQGNSLIRGPSDVVNNILSTVSPAYAADSTASPLLPCDEGHTLTFQIGGQLFPVDPRDFVAQNKQGDATNCVASNVVSTDAPSTGALFSWNLGDPFLKSNMVVFYYGNLTHPSVDPPRMGFVSLVPQNAEALLDDAVGDAKSAAGAFECESLVFFRSWSCVSRTDDACSIAATAEAAPTASSLILEGAASASATSESTSSTPAATRTSTPSSASPSSPAAPAATLTATTTASTTPKSAPVASVLALPSLSPNAAAPRLVGGWWLALPTLSLFASLCIL